VVLESDILFSADVAEAAKVTGSIVNNRNVCVVVVVRMLLEKEKKEREEAEKKRQELEQELNRYSAQYENTQQGSDLFTTNAAFLRAPK